MEAIKEITNVLLPINKKFKDVFEQAVYQNPIVNKIKNILPKQASCVTNINEKKKEITIRPGDMASHRMLMQKSTEINRITKGYKVFLTSVNGKIRKTFVEWKQIADSFFIEIDDYFYEIFEQEDTTAEGIGGKTQTADAGSKIATQPSPQSVYQSDIGNQLSKIIQSMRLSSNSMFFMDQQDGKYFLCIVSPSKTENIIDQRNLAIQTNITKIRDVFTAVKTPLAGLKVGYLDNNRITVKWVEHKIIIPK